MYNGWSGVASGWVSPWRLLGWDSTRRSPGSEQSHLAQAKERFSPFSLSSCDKMEQLKIMYIVTVIFERYRKVREREVETLLKWCEHWSSLVWLTDIKLTG